MTFSKDTTAFTTTTSDTKKTTTTTTKQNAPSVPTPPAAAKDGCTKLAFSDEFDSLSTFDFRGTGAPGYTWYTDPPYNKTAPIVNRDYSIANSILRMDPQVSNENLLCSYSKKGQTGYVWRYGYAECRMRFDTSNVALASEGRMGWPAFWGIALTDFLGQSWTDCGELDVMEAFLVDGNNGSGGVYYSGALHHHKRVNGEAQKNGVNLVNALGYKGKKYLIDSNWHTYAALWREGYIAWYIDDVFMHSLEFSKDELPVFYSKDADGPIHVAENANNWPGVHYIMNDEQQVMLLGTGKKWPMEIDWVRVWEYEN
jgi:beta-glucanase (GH16 family)